MLQSKFAKKNLRFKAQKIFTDRTQPRTVFRESIEAIAQKPRGIVNYYGKGGIGKTSLLRNILSGSGELYARKKAPAFCNIFLSLDAFEYGNPVNILTGIRNGVQGDCGLFDYAMTQYYAKARMTIEEIKNKNNLLSSSVMGILNEAISLVTASACIPVSILGKCASLIKDVQLRTKYRDEIAQIATLNEFEIFERLPYYLGICINNAYEKGKFHVLFLDSYESLLNRTVGGTPSTDPEEWLREFFLSCEHIRIVIASRDKLRWDRLDPEWSDLIDAHLLRDLSEEDSLWFLGQVPIAEEETAKKIAKHAAGVPLYLDMCVDLYEAAKNRGEPFDADALGEKGLITDRYIRHLSDKDSYALKVLSVPRMFRLQFAKQLLAKQNLAYTADELRVLCEKSVVLPLNESRQLYKVDESVRSHLLEHMREEEKADILEDIFDCISAEKGACVFPYFASALDTLIADPPCFEKLYKKVFAIAEFYAGAGYWRELHVFLRKYLRAENEKLRALAVIAEILYLRRSGSLQEAEKFIENNPVTKEQAGVWHYYYRFLCIHVRHLLGHYDESLAAYRALLDEMELVRHALPAHLYALVAIKYADLLFLKGNFEESLARTEELLKSGDLSMDDRLELIRLKGHNYRFRRQNRQAELVYSSALQFAKEYNMRSANGKLYTNLTETLCTEKPMQALVWYKRSIAENKKLENYIELGKAYAAGAVAYAKVRDTKTALSLAMLALETAKQTNYRSGQAFALAALAYVCKEAGDAEKSAAYLAQLKTLLDELNVYRYILGWFANEQN